MTKAMRRVFLAAAIVVLGFGPAAARDVTVTFTDDEQKALFEVLDAAVKAQGMQAANNALYIWNKVVAAAKEAEKANGKAKEAK